MARGTWTGMEMVPSVRVATPAYNFRGEAGWSSVVGDWDGDGTTNLGIYKEGVWYLDWNGNGAWEDGTDKVYNNPARNDFIPVIGDWNGDGKTEIGIYRWGYWSLDFSWGRNIFGFPKIHRRRIFHTCCRRLEWGWKNRDRSV